MDFYKTTGGILNKMAKDMEERCKNFSKVVSEAKNPKVRTERMIREYFAKVYKYIIKEIFIDTMRSAYYTKGVTKKTTCGEPCKNRRPCTHIVWEGWKCPQHGGGRKD